MIPTATYRFQFHRHFTFSDALIWFRSRLLALRNAKPELFTHGDYLALAPEGPRVGWTTCLCLRQSYLATNTNSSRFAMLCSIKR